MSDVKGEVKGSLRVPQTRVTSTDVAKAAGVSQSVVSRAFTVGGKVSAKTRARVLLVAAQLGYQPNAMARGLVTQRSNLVGVVVGDSANPFYSQVLTRFSEELQVLGKQVLLLTTGDAEHALLLALQYRVEAIIITTAALSSPVAAAFAGSGVPVVFFNRYAEQPGSWAVSCDNVGGGRTVAEVLLGAGHQRFAFIGGKPDTSTNQDRREGFRVRLREAGVDLELSVEKEYTYEWGYHAARYLPGVGSGFTLGPAIDAVFCANDIVALGVLDALRESGRRVPEDVAVVGFDDIPAASWRGYALTTVAQPVEGMIGATLELLSRYGSNDPDTDPSAEGVVLLPGPFVERATTRPRVLAGAG